MSTITVLSRPIDSKFYPNLMVLILVLTDIICLSFAGLIAFLAHWAVQGVPAVSMYVSTVPFISLYIVTFAVMGLYSGISLSPAEEMRKSTVACLLISFCVAVCTLSIRQSHLVFTWTIGLAVTLGILFIPLGREIVRLRFARAPWWGYPALVLGDEASGAYLIQILQDRPELGLKPVAVMCVGSDAHHLSGVPIVQENELARWESVLKGHGYALFSSAARSRDSFRELLNRNRTLFPRVLMISENWEFSCYSISAKEFGGLPAFEVCEHLFRPGKQACKRLLDVVLGSVFSFAALPLLLLIAVAIRLDSHGPILYAQNRIGRRGREFRAWKFRSMVQNADALLKQYLAEHPDLASEWERSHKLRHDPRITRLGRFLRKTSLDELPQLWNVLRGEMSLVGPRPIVREEIARYGDQFHAYASVRSGLTGLWQVSGRSQTSYAERVTFDTFYVRNWSVWLDFYILLRTVRVLCSRAGAY